MKSESGGAVLSGEGPGPSSVEVPPLSLAVCLKLPSPVPRPPGAPFPPCSILVGPRGASLTSPPRCAAILPGLGRGAPEQTGRPWLWRCLLRLTGPAPTPCPGDRSLSPSSWLEAALTGEVDCRRQVRRAVPAHGGAAVPLPLGS